MKWSDGSTSSEPGSKASGTLALGMGLLPAYRGAGYGRRLAEKAIAAAQLGGIERIELEVFATNAVAMPYRHQRASPANSTAGRHLAHGAVSWPERSGRPPLASWFDLRKTDS